MRFPRHVTQRVASAVLAVVSVVLLATCDLAKITSPTKGGVGPSIQFAIKGDTLLVLGDSLALAVDAGSADLKHTIQRWSSSAPLIVSVDSARGVTRGLGLGLATITARLLAPELDTGVLARHVLRVRYKSIRVGAIDSIAGLGLTRAIVVNGTNAQNALVTPAITSTATLSAHDSGGTAATVVSVNGQNVVARKPGKAYLVALFDKMKDSVVVKVRQVTKSITFLATPYVANAVCTGTCPNGRRVIPATVRDVADSIIVSPALRWLSSDTTMIAIDSVTGAMRVKSLSPTATITVRSDTVTRTQTVSVAQVVGTLTKLASTDSQMATVANAVTLPPQVTALDSGNTPVAGAAVTFRVASGGGIVTDSVKITDSNGRAALGAWQVGRVAGANSVVASAGGASATFVATGIADVPYKLGFATNPRSVGLNSRIAPAIRVAVQDSLGNTNTSATSSVTLAIAYNPGAATLGGTVTKSAVNGIATFDSVSLNSTGSGYTLQASSGTLGGAISNGFDVYGTATKLAFVTQPAGTSAGAVMAPVRVAIQDAQGNIVDTVTQSVTIAFGTNAGGTATLGGTKTVAAVKGIATFSDLTVSTAAAGYTLLASATALTSATSNAFTISPPAAAAKLAFSVQPSDVAAGASITPAIKVQVQDANGALVTSSTQQISLSIGTNPSDATLGGTLTVAAVNGEATFSNVSLTKAGSGFTLVASAPSTTLTSATSTAFTVRAGAATKLGFVQQPTYFPAGTTITPAVTVAVQDASGNTVTSQPATGVSLALSGCTATLTGTTSAQTSGGVATFGNLSIATSASNCVLVATATSLTQATSVAFNAQPTGGVVKVAFTTEPSPTATAGSVMTPFAVTLQDANGANISNAGGSATVTLSVLSGPGRLLGTTSATTPATGTATATFSNVSIREAGTYQLLVSAGGLRSDTSAAFTVSAGPAYKVGFVTLPSSIVAGVPFSPVVQAAIQDQYGNTVTSATNVIQLTATSTATSTSVPFSPGVFSVTATAVSGVATFTNLTIKKASSADRLVASAPGTSLFGTQSANVFDVVAAPLSELGFVQQPTTATAGTVISPAVTVQGQDSVGNVYTDFANPVTVALIGGTTGAILGGTKTVTPSSGVASFSTLTIDKSGTQYHLVATASGVSGATSRAFAIGAGTPTKLVWLAQPQNTFVNAPLNPAGPLPRVALQDAAGNVAATDNSTIVRIQVQSGASTTFRSGTASVTFVDIAVVNGVATIPGTVAMTTPGTYVLTASTPFLTGVTTANTTSFTVAAFDVKAKLGFVQQPSNVIVGKAMSPAVTVAVQDRYGNTVTTASDAIALAIGKDANPTTTLTGGTAVAAASGVATFSALSLDKSGIGYTLVASATGLTSATSVSFNASTTASWTSLQPMIAARNSPATDAIGGLLYVAGGHDGSTDNSALQIYNPATNSWSFGANMPAGRYQSSGGSAVNGKLYVPGGWTTAGGLPTNTLYIYDATANTWTSGAAMPTLSACGGSGVIGGKLYVTTSCNGSSGYFSLLHVYDPGLNTWTALANSPNAHGYPAVGVIGGKLYVVGGYNAAGTAVTGSLDIYDPVANTWTTGAALPTARSGAVGAVVNGKLYVIGGYNGTTTVTNVDVYDPVTNTWTSGTAAPVARQVMGVGVISGYIYVAGGSGASPVLNTLQAYSP